MKTNMARILLSVFLLFVLIISNMTPVAAEGDSYEIIREPFSVDADQPRNFVEAGTTIHHLSNGITEVHRRDKSLKLKARESDAKLISTPSGQMKANRLYNVPAGAYVDSTGNITRIFGSDKTLLVTILDDTLKPVTPAATVWLEAGQDTNVTSLDWWDASWIVPSKPPHSTNSDNNTVFFFSGIVPQSDLNTIIQPVLQWNQVVNGSLSHNWTIASWDAFAGGSAIGPMLNVSEGDPILGTMSYNNNWWTISIWKDGSPNKSSIAVNNLDNQNLKTYVALESNNWTVGDDDLSGSAYFTDMTFGGLPAGETITWADRPHNFPPLPFNSNNDTFVTFDSDPSHIELYTHNLSANTTLATNITTTNATIHGTLDRVGSTGSANVSFEYGLTKAYSTNTSSLSMNTTGGFYLNLTGLESGKTYHFRAKAVNGAGTAYGADETFTTDNNSLVAVTNPATIINTTSAQLNGAVTSFGGSSNATVSFEYGSSPAYGQTVDGVPSTLANKGSFASNVTGLSAGTTYYYRAKAVGQTTAYGDNLTFTTPHVPVKVTTDNASGIMAFSATLNGRITDMGTVPGASVSFDYWKSTDNSNSTTNVTAIPASMNATGSFSANATGLSANATYYFHAKAVGGNITSFGNAGNFTTPGNWWNTDWTKRQKLTFDTTSISSNLTSFPALVHLTSSNFSFNSAQPDGDDLRFIDTDNTTINYEVESYNGTAGEAWVWVNVPRLDGNSTTDYIWMYYGNNVTGSGANAIGVWNSDFMGVYHMDQSPSGQILDSTSNGRHLTSYGSMNSTDLVDGKIWKAVDFDGTDDYLRNASALAWLSGGNYTLEVWGYHRSLKGVFALGPYTDSRSAEEETSSYQGKRAYANVNGTWQYGNTSLPTTTWIYEAFYHGNTENALKIFYNGQLDKSATSYSWDSYTGNSYLQIGRGQAVTNGDYVNGVIDEVRISKAARSADWLKASYLSEMDALITFGSQESY